MTTPSPSNSLPFTHTTPASSKPPSLKPSVTGPASSKPTSQRSKEREPYSPWKPLTTSYIAPTSAPNPLSSKPSYFAPNEVDVKKPPAAIEIWRHEVSASTSPVSGPGTPPDGEVEVPKGFWKKVLQPKKSLAVLRGKVGDGSERSGDEELCKTEMYDRKARVEFKLKLEPGDEREGAGERPKKEGGMLDVEGDGEDGGRSSMELLTSGSGSEELNSVKERRERLERAARLLGKGKKGNGR